MKIQDLRQKTKQEIAKLLVDSRERLRLLRFDLAAGKVKNVREIRQLKKDIARILTLLIELRDSGAKIKKRIKFSSPK
ncbi:MAG: 50S ribosomal protein L29 [Candidatus Nealsonbacteria bacterium]|nr:50S ribosomal protein L29 [Candidatus Nealsonbacteria bacterium]